MKQLPSFVMLTNIEEESAIDRAAVIRKIETAIEEQLRTIMDILGVYFRCQYSYTGELKIGILRTKIIDKRVENSFDFSVLLIQLNCPDRQSPSGTGHL